VGGSGCTPGHPVFFSRKIITKKNKLHGNDNFDYFTMLKQRIELALFASFY
jgi:hypothetical protein